jgi:hypothetical protein
MMERSQSHFGMGCQGLEPQRTADTCIASIDMLTSFIGDLLSFIFVEADVMLVRTGSCNGREKEEENQEKGAAGPAVRRGGTCKVHEAMTKRLGLVLLQHVKHCREYRFQSSASHQS